MPCRNCAFRKRIKDYTRYQPEKAVYLDYNATTPPDVRTLGIFENACRNIWGNPSSLHGLGQSAFDILEDSRNKIGKYLNLINSESIFFTNSTYNALVSVIRLFLENKNIKRIITTAVEHHAVLKAVELFEVGECEIVTLNVDNNGKINSEELNRYTGEIGSILVYSPVNHETGSIQDFRKIYEIVSNNNSLVVMDAVQAICRIRAEELHPFSHAFIISAHKIYGLKGTVLLYICQEAEIDKDRELFYGTPDTASIAAFSETIRIYSSRINEDIHQFKLLTEDLYRILDNSEIEYQRESPEASVPGIINISITERDLDMEELFFHFHKEKICLSRFSACTGKIEGPSEILEAMGVTGRRSRQSLRISLGRQSSRKDFFRFTAVLKKFLLDR
jgi:cysteine desulfurase